MEKSAGRKERPAGSQSEAGSLPAGADGAVYLTDISRLLPQIRHHDWPQYQYTIRDVRTGLLFVACADHITKSHACAAAFRFLTHLERKGDTSQVTIQTDNGSEFDAQVIHQTDRGFRYTVEGLMDASHWFIPPAAVMGRRRGDNPPAHRGRIIRP